MAKKKAKARARKAPVLEIEQWATETVIPYTDNPRKNQPIEEVAQSIERFGWVQPIVTDRKGVIVIGDTRWRAARARGWPTVPVYVHSGLTEAQAQALRVADNKLGESAAWDKAGLLGELQKITAAGIEVEVTGFDSATMTKLQQELTGTRPRPDVPFSEELGEANNYIVLVFRTEVDWLQAKDHFQLDSRYSKRQNGKPWAKGIGRVVDGAAYLDRLVGE